MDLAQRLSHLESVHDWHGLVEELEKGIAAGAANEVRAAYHLRLGRILESKFLSGVKALKHFQDAFKLSPQLLAALRHARSIYWSLGKVNMVQKLLELELKVVKDDPIATSLLLEPQLLRPLHVVAHGLHVDAGARDLQLVEDLHRLELEDPAAGQPREHDVLRHLALRPRGGPERAARHVPLEHHGGVVALVAEHELAAWQVEDGVVLVELAKHAEQEGTKRVGS